MFWNTVYPTSEPATKRVSTDALRDFETAEVASEVLEFDPDEPSSLATSSFDWEHGKYRSAAIWLFVIGQLLLGALMMILGLVLSKSFERGGGYSIWAKRAAQAIPKIEVTRWLVQLGIPFFLYALLQLIFALVPYFGMMFSKLLGKNCPAFRTRLRIDGLLKLRRPIGMAFFGCIAAIISRQLFVNETVQGSPGAADDSNPVLAFGAELVAYATKNHFEFFVNRFFLSLAVITLLVLVEKFFVLNVGVKYHREGLARRQAANRLFRKITKRLCDHFVKTKQTADPKAGQGELIFDAIGKPKVGKKDFEAYMDEDEAAAYFFHIDQDNGGGEGELSREEFVASVARLKGEEKAMERAMLDSSGLIGKLDSILVTIVIMVSSIIVLAIFEPPLSVVLSYIISVFASLVFLFGSTAKNLFESISYVIFNHPFDQEDWLMLSDGILYQVKEIGLITSSFLTPQNDLVYMNNLSLMGQTVINLKRSIEMNENITVSVLPETPKDKIAELESICKKWLTEHPHLFLPNFFFRDFLVTDNLHMVFKMRLWHRANFDDMTKKDHRTRLFMLHLKESMEKLQIKASPPVLPSSVKPFA